MIECACLCGNIRFKLNGSLRSVRYCHCSSCRKFAGTSPAAWAMADTADLDRPNADLVGRFDSGRGIRCFCRECGSPVWFESKDFPEITGIPLGVVDSGSVPPPEMHLWVQSNPAWCPIQDDLPQFSAGPDQVPSSKQR